MRVLLTTRDLDQPGGVQLYVSDIAAGLLERGHTPIVHATKLGEVARKLANQTVAVVDDLDRIAVEPDLVHGQYGVETLAALLRFPRMPGIFVCHTWSSWVQAPPLFPRILRYVAVDETCRDRLLLQHGIPESRLSLMLNFADLQRFKPRKSLPARPRRALLFSNYEPPDASSRALDQACAQLGIALDRAGRAGDRVYERPEDLLGRYELVFAKGRSAIEAMAVGSAVILWGIACSGELVTSENFERLRQQNFGRRALGRPADVGRLVEQIQRYDAADAARVAGRIRSEASREAAVEDYLKLYDEVVAEAVGMAVDPLEEHAAAARYLAWLASQEGDRKRTPPRPAPHPGLTRRLARRVARSIWRAPGGPHG